MKIETFVQNLLLAWNSGDVRRIVELYAPDAVVHHPFSPAPLRGREAIAALESGLFSAFSDIAWRVESSVEQGQRVAIEFSVAATNTGPLPTPKGAVPATGRRIEVRGASFVTLSPGGAVTEERRYFDVAGMFAQLGLGG